MPSIGEGRLRDRRGGRGRRAASAGRTALGRLWRSMHTVVEIRAGVAQRVDFCHWGGQVGGDPRRSRSALPKTKAVVSRRATLSLVAGAQLRRSGRPYAQLRGAEPGQHGERAARRPDREPPSRGAAGLTKMRLLSSLGVGQAVLPPAPRPDVEALRRLGFRGGDADVLRAAAAGDAHLLRLVSSASSMWSANAATVAPSADTRDGRVHLTVANLSRCSIGARSEDDARVAPRHLRRPGALRRTWPAPAGIAFRR